MFSNIVKLMVQNYANPAVKLFKKPLKVVLYEYVDKKVK